MFNLNSILLTFTVEHLRPNIEEYPWDIRTSYDTGTGGIYNWPSISTGFVSVDSTNHRSKILKKNSRWFQKAKFDFAMLATIYVAFTLNL